jgi:hypothetical protein
MSTWKGEPHIYRLEVYDIYGYSDCGNVEYKWEYNTTSDTLVIISTEEKKEPTCEYFGRDNAIAQMETLLDWFSTYEGMESLEALIEGIRKAKND